MEEEVVILYIRVRKRLLDRLNKVIYSNPFPLHLLLPFISLVSALVLG